ncbi:MAG: acetyl-CoA carboxylase biotin carboxyl carrier protein [Proteobacteria bacterium]|nr:acetyl-CoA carboxylase biotin carboxyl carrier protein [Pseudomonadota bacterium]MCP4915345.1 acetyl-CoA carboxylase biotin carboxyl carrier protein [Pseudomonadota bacterium]
MDVERIEALLKVLNENEVAEFNYEDESISVTVSFGRAQVVQMAAAPVVAAAAAAVPVAAAPAGEDLENDPSLSTLPSPMVGTFYRAPSPDSENFVKLGDEVKKGQVLCIIEAMKLMNEIESEADGVVAAILVDNAQPVQFGQPLFKIKTS